MSDAQEYTQEFPVNYLDDPCDDITLIEEWTKWLLYYTESSTQTDADKS